jgi:hypothetical protein
LNEGGVYVDTSKTSTLGCPSFGARKDIKAASATSRLKDLKPFQAVVMRTTINQILMQFALAWFRKLRRNRAQSRCAGDKYESSEEYSRSWVLLGKMLQLLGSNNGRGVDDE